MHKILAALLAALAALALPAAEPLPLERLTIGSGTLAVELATTEKQMARGLMYRKSLGKSSGMLFRFAAPRPVSMWMKNTYIELDAAFVDACGQIVRIARMQPLTLVLHESGIPVLHVIEANAGWFSAHRAAAGTFIPELASGLCRQPRP